MVSRRSFLSGIGIAGVVGIGGYLGRPLGLLGDSELEEREHNRDAPTGATFQSRRSDAGNAGYQRGTPADESNALYWRSKLQGSTFDLAGVAVDAGTVFVGNGELYALDQADGSLRWTSGASGALTAPAVGEDVIVAGEHFGSESADDWDGGLRAFDPADGGERWRNDVVGSSGAAPTVRDGTAYVGGNEGNPHVSAVDVATGELDWRTRLDSGAARSPSVSAAGVFVETDAALRRIDPADGSKGWRVETTTPESFYFDVHGSPYSRIADPPPIVSDGVVYAQEGPATFAARDAASGDLLWSFEGVESPDNTMSTCAGGDTVFLAYNGESASRLIAFDARDGTIRWPDLENDPLATPRGAPLVTDESLYVVWQKGVLARDRADGEFRWSRRFPRERIAKQLRIVAPKSIAVVDGTVFGLGASGDLLAISA